MMHSRGCHEFIVLTYAMFALNAIGSFMYHWTGQVGWAHVDEYSMTVAAVLPAYTIFEEMSVFYGFKFRTWSLTFAGWFMVLSFTIGALDLPGEITSVFFAVPIAFLVACCLLATFNTKYVENENVTDEEKRMLVGGVCTALGSTVVWVVTETLCPTVPAMRYVYGHVIWHVGMPYGLYCVLMFISTTRANEAGATSRILYLSGKLPYAVVYN